MSTMKFGVTDDGVTVTPSPDQYLAWTRSAADKPLSAWLEELADDAAAERINERTWPAIVVLKHPIEFGSQRIAQLELRRGKLADIKGMKLSAEMPTEHLITIASRLSGQTTQVIDRLDVDDAGEVMAIAIDFYGKCLGGGRTR
jgi:hypothetical protein